MLRGCLLPETVSGLNHRGLFFCQLIFLGPSLLFPFHSQMYCREVGCCTLFFVQEVVCRSLCSRGVPWAHPPREASCLSWDHDLESVPVTQPHVCHAVLWAITLACGAAFKARALHRLGMWHTQKAVIFILYLLTNCKSVILRMFSILASLQASLISLWKTKRCSLWLTAGLKWHI